MHSTDDLDDGYVGSGQILWRSIKKHGKENHLCEVLEYYPDRVSVANREKEILTKEFRSDPLCMNISGGGYGNYDGRPTAEETRRKMSEARKGRPKSEEHKRKLSEKHKTLGEKRTEEGKALWRSKVEGRVQSEEERAMRSEAAKKKPNYNVKALIIDGIEYEHCKAASEALGIPSKTIYNRCMSTSIRFGQYNFKE